MYKFTQRTLERALRREFDVERHVKRWEIYANRYYQQLYTLYDKSTRERRSLAGQWLVLRETMPATYATGVHCIGRGLACMGEDIYVVDGYLQHNTHIRHEKCGTYATVRRAEESPSGSHLWCATCNKELQWLTRP